MYCMSCSLNTGMVERGCTVGGAAGGDSEIENKVDS